MVSSKFKKMQFLSFQNPEAYKLVYRPKTEYQWLIAAKKEVLTLILYQPYRITNFLIRVSQKLLIWTYHLSHLRLQYSSFIL